MNHPYWPDNRVYFLTGTTFLHYPYFKEYNQKQIVLEQIKRLNKILHIQISAYSIAINHYHLKFYLKRGLDLAKIKQYIHGGISFEYKKKFKVRYKEMWQDSKTLQVLSDDADWKITGYIAGNLLKHREVNNFGELLVSPFSSSWYLVKKYGKNNACQLVKSVISIQEKANGEIDFRNLNNLKIVKPSAKAG